MMSLFFSLKKSEGRTKLFQMKSKTLWIKSLRVEDQSMRLIKSAKGWRLKRWSWRQPFPKQKELWNKRKIRFSVV